MKGFYPGQSCLFCIDFNHFSVDAASGLEVCAPGLYQNERKAVSFLLATPVLFALGAAMVYYIVVRWPGIFPVF